MSEAVIRYTPDVDLESFLLVVTAPAWFPLVVFWCGWCWICDWKERMARV